jgi:hypothetical protein
MVMLYTPLYHYIVNLAIVSGIYPQDHDQPPESLTMPRSYSLIGHPIEPQAKMHFRGRSSNMSSFMHTQADRNNARNCHSVVNNDLLNVYVVIDYIFGFI